MGEFETGIINPTKKAVFNLAVMNKLISESQSSLELHLQALYGRINYERQDRVRPHQFKLRNMQEILRRLDDPHLKYPVLHVAGTKGKGSVSTMLGRILSTSGRRTGVYTSPHLETIHQRMVIDNVPITDQQLLETLAELKPVIDSMDEDAKANDHRHLTFFEITTAAALHFFASQNCDAVVLEVGLGGRLDSTNVCQPLTSIITSISIDHTRQLGETVDKIAFEKAGIIKPTIPVISGAVDSQSAQVIAQVAAEKQSPLSVLGRDFEFDDNKSGTERDFSCSGQVGFNVAKEHPVCGDSAAPVGQYHSSHSSYPFHVNNIELNLIGQHQRANAAVAIAAIQTLNGRGWNISDDEIRTGLAQASLAGRTEVVSLSPAVVVDMAHNVASIHALVTALKEDFPAWQSANRRTVILATSRDKDAPGMLQPLVEDFDRVILTRYQDNPRGIPVDDLSTIAGEIRNDLKSNLRSAAEIVCEPDPIAAWKQTYGKICNDELVCITGSAFLVAELRSIVIEAIAKQREFENGLKN